MVDSMSGVSNPKVSSVAPSQYNVSLPHEQFPIWWRGLVGVAYVCIGVTVASIGLASISYRLSHMTIGGGLINGRAVRIQAPVDGKIQQFYARPGAKVRAGQVLAELTPAVLQSPGKVQGNRPLGLPNAMVSDPLAQQATEIQLASTQQTLALLNQQLQEVNRQEAVLQSVTVEVASENVGYSAAAVTAARSQESAARNKYERFSVLLAKGAVSRQEVDELEADWRSSQAAVEQAQSEQAVAQLNADAIAQQAPLQSNLKDLQTQRRRLMAEIQRQASREDLLAMELQSPLSGTPTPEGDVESVSKAGASQVPNVSDPVANGPLAVATPVNAANTRSLPLLAPFDGVIYATNHDAGEQVNRPTVLLSLLDCNDLWVETLVSTDQASRIDTGKPVRIQHNGQSETVVGHVDFVTAMTAGEITKARSEALIPNAAANLNGQSLARVRVRMPSNPIQEQAYRFCGVGETVKLTFGTQTSVTKFLSRLSIF